MKYAPPELIVILPAAHVIQNIAVGKSSRYRVVETTLQGETNEPSFGYTDWE
jgi:hypothetical protein